MSIITNLEEQLMSALNPTGASVNSIYGIVFIGIIVLLIFRSFRKSTSPILWIVGFIVILEIGHILIYDTDIFLSEWTVLQFLFKYDIFTGLAQLFPGTAFAEFFLYFEAFLLAVIRVVVNALGTLFNIGVSIFEQVR